MPPAISMKTVSSFWNLLKVILAIALLFFVFSKTNLPDLTKTLQNISVPWLTVSVILFILVTLLKALQYHILMHEKMSYFQVLNLIVWQNVVSNYLMTGAGVVTYVTMTRMEHEMKISRSMTAFLLTKIGDLMAIGLTLLFSAVLLGSQIARLQGIVWFLLFMVGALVLVFFLSVFFRQKFVFWLANLLSHTPLSGSNLVQRALDYVQSLANMDPDKVMNMLGRLFLCSLVYLGASMAWVYASYAVFHLQLEPVKFVFVSVLMQLISYIPIVVFGGLGLTETSSLYLFGVFGISQASLAPVLVGNRILFYLLNLLPLIYLPLYEILQRNKRKTN